MPCWPVFAMPELYFLKNWPLFLWTKKEFSMERVRVANFEWKNIWCHHDSIVGPSSLGNCSYLSTPSAQWKTKRSFVQVEYGVLFGFSNRSETKNEGSDVLHMHDVSGIILKYERLGRFMEGSILVFLTWKCLTNVKSYFASNGQRNFLSHYETLWDLKLYSLISC